MNFIKKYKHGFVIVTYSILYLCIFQYLEQRHVYSYHLIHCALDDLIPFCEYFIVPYLLWFPYQVFVIAYFIFFNKEKREYYQLTLNLCMGMTVFLIVSWLYPNIQLLRPAVFTGDSLFIRAVQQLYSMDTPTNILPSIHVFNSIAIHLAICKCEQLKDKKWLKRGAGILTFLIILSTMFLKQHSVIDVTLGSAMAGAGYLLFYSRPACKRACCVQEKHQLNP
ncbi:MAG: phosphatase PAP2 family protein [Lachnospiraceae bacterium]|nr:phosphatase PAP2 family protein [Lachnospiraceae bacterium]MDY4769312.1 phosphatase PAP2 family protein [Lachnospiraceae bacterium]